MRPGELARLIGVSSDTLRHYERLGLLPKPPRTNGGYRVYPADARDRVLLIRRALRLGFSLEELARILAVRDRGGLPCHETRKLAQTKLQEVNQRIKELAAMRRQLQQMLKRWDVRLADTRPGQPARLLENIPEKLAEGAFRSPLKRKRGGNKQ